MAKRRRKRLNHTPPDWVEDGAVYFITICHADHGSRQLVDQEIAHRIEEATRVYQEIGKWWIKLFLLMPDHVHGLISFNQKEAPMAAIIGTFKGYLARHYGVCWQDDFFDHRLRTTHAVREKAQYIRLNPTRAGLVDDPGDWPHVWTGESFRR